VHTHALALRITERPPLCDPPRVGCIETEIDGHIWPIADQDRIVIDWGGADIGPVIARTRHLYIPIDPTTVSTLPEPATIDVVASNDTVRLIVSQSGSRHTVPIALDTWVELPLSDHAHPLYVRLESGQDGAALRPN
jgi:hypothetical protein